MNELLRKLRVLFRRDSFDADLDKEMRAHIEMQADENRDNGMDAAEARYAAQRNFGNATLLKEDSRSLWGWASLERLTQDLRYAFRTMRRSPGLTLAAIVSLALGIGASSALFSAMDAFWFRPLHINNPDSLVRMFATTERDQLTGMAYADYLDYAEATQTFASLAASQRRGPMLTVNGVTESMLTEVVSDNYFTVLGVNAALGRFFDERMRGEQTLVLSHRVWQSRFGGDPRIIGKHVELGGRPFAVLGVAPKEFRGVELTMDIDLWLPMSVWDAGEQFDRRTQNFAVIGRLQPGIAIEQARANVAAIARNLAIAYPQTNKNRGAMVLSNRQYQVESGGTSAIVFSVIVIVLLLISCANIANLLLARGESRRREVAVRLALGCGRLRLIRQLFTESLLLALLGAVAGISIAATLIHVLPSLLPAGTTQFQMDHRVLGFALLATLLTGLVFGLFPSIRASRPDLTPVLKTETSHRRYGAIPLRDGIVAAQMALSVLLLACAGLLVKSFLHCLNLDVGFQRKNALIVRLDPGLPEAQARILYRQLLERASALPGVKQSALARRAPLWPSEGGITTKVTIPGYSTADGETVQRIKFNTVDANYFQTLGIPILRGRRFDRRDSATGTRVAIVNETMARRYWMGANPIGKLISAGQRELNQMQIVGVAKDTKVNWILETPEPYLYLPFEQDFAWSMSLILESSADPLLLASPMRDEIRSLRDIPAPEIATLESLLDSSNSEQRRMAMVVSVLGALAILLTAAGLYGVLSFVVARRTHEIGIRMALGADKRDTLILVVRRAVAIAGVGAALGIAGALSMSRILSNLLFGVSPYDPATFAMAYVTLTAVAVFAGLAPAIRASSIDPVKALRHE